MKSAHKDMLELLKLNEELIASILYSSGETREGSGILPQLEDKIKDLDFKPGMGLKKQIESYNKLVLDSEGLGKTIRRLLSKEVKYFKR